jgi:threonyl-tRNA synthetase
VLHGLLRVREFTQDDAHIFCTPEQIKENVLEVVGFIDSIMKKFNFNYEMLIATKPAKAIGEDAIWDKATEALIEALKYNNLPFDIDEGGGAFYGPKIDIKITDALKRKWQCGTIQVDMNLPERFDISYTTSQDKRERPVMIHRAILGSFERFIGILTEHYAGEFPLSIAPTGVIIVPIADSHLEYAKQLSRELQMIDIDSEVFSQNESLNKRIRIAEKQRVPMIIVVGDDEVVNEKVALRDRRKRERSEMSKHEFIDMLQQQKAGEKI